MTQVRTDAQGATAQGRAGPGGSKPRPISPHLQIWRWHVTMAASIATRFTGVALYVGAIILAVWAACLASGPGAYGVCMAVLTSPIGWLVLFGLTVSVFYHLAAGIRHLAWDIGKGFLPRTANATSWAAFAFAIVASVALFAGGLLLRSH